MDNYRPARVAVTEDKPDVLAILVPLDVYAIYDERVFIVVHGFAPRLIDTHLG
jgi:hypothetical protein